MNELMIEVGEQYITHDGSISRVLCTNQKGTRYPCVLLVTPVGQTEEVVHNVNLIGRSNIPSHKWDPVSIYISPKSSTETIYLAEDSDGSVYMTFNDSFDSNIIGQKVITIIEGEGLRVEEMIIGPIASCKDAVSVRNRLDELGWRSVSVDSCISEPFSVYLKDQDWISSMDENPNISVANFLSFTQKVFKADLSGDDS